MPFSNRGGEEVDQKKAVFKIKEDFI